MERNKFCSELEYYKLFDYNVSSLEETLRECNISKPYHNSVGISYADYILKYSLPNFAVQKVLSYKFLGILLNDLKYYFNSVGIKLPVQYPDYKLLTPVKDEIRIIEESTKNVNKLKYIISSNWFNENHAEILGITKLDKAIIDNDEKAIKSQLDSGPNMCDLSPPARAKYLKGLKATFYKDAYLNVVSNSKYCSDVSYVKIKDPNLPTLILISGPGETAWNYSLLKFFEDIIEQNQSMNLVIIGDGEREIELEDIEYTIVSSVVTKIKGEVLLYINTHGNTYDNKYHHIFLNDEDVVFTHSLLNMISKVFLDKELHVFLDSCHSGAIMFDYKLKLPSGSEIFSVTSANQTSSSTSTKLMLQHMNKDVSLSYKFLVTNYLANIVKYTSGKEGFGNDKSPTIVRFEDGTKVEFSLEKFFINENFGEFYKQNQIVVGKNLKDLLNETVTENPNMDNTEYNLALALSYLTWETLNENKNLQCFNAGEDLWGDLYQCKDLSMQVLIGMSGFPGIVNVAEDIEI